MHILLKQAGIRHVRGFEDNAWKRTASAVVQFHNFELYKQVTKWDIFYNIDIEYFKLTRHLAGFSWPQ